MIELVVLGVSLAFGLATVTRVASQVANARALAARTVVAQYAFAGLERVLGGKAQVSEDGSLRVQVDGLFLHVRLVDAHRSQPRFRLVLGLMPGDVAIRAESVTVQVGGRRRGPEDLETGDAEFDRAVWVEGPEQATVARLDAPARAAIRALVALGGALADGHWRVEVQGPRDEGDGAYAGLERAARLLRAAGRPWVAATLPVQALTGIALHDPVPAVRARALLRLFRKPWSAVTPFSEVARRVAGEDLIRALGAPSPDVVVAAALLLRLEGTGAAVPALRAAAARLAGSAERDAVEQAVAAIQSRVGPAHGALSVAEGDGALSVAEDGGQVSVVAGPPVSGSGHAPVPTAAPPPRPRG